MVDQDCVLLMFLLSKKKKKRLVSLDRTTANNYPRKGRRYLNLKAGEFLLLSSPSSLLSSKLSAVCRKNESFSPFFSSSSSSSLFLKYYASGLLFVWEREGGVKNALVNHFSLFLTTRNDDRSVDPFVKLIFLHEIMSYNTDREGEKMTLSLHPLAPFCLLTAAFSTNQYWFTNVCERMCGGVSHHHHLPVIWRKRREAKREMFWRRVKSLQTHKQMRAVYHFTKWDSSHGKWLRGREKYEGEKEKRDERWWGEWRRWRIRRREKNTTTNWKKWKSNRIIIVMKMIRRRENTYDDVIREVDLKF